MEPPRYHTENQNKEFYRGRVNYRQQIFAPSFIVPSFPTNQDYNITKKIISQDNQNTILLERTSRLSSGQEPDMSLLEITLSRTTKEEMK